MSAWAVGALLGFVAFGIAFAVARARGYREAKRIEWERDHRPCWYCDGPEGARARLQQHRATNLGLPMPYAPAPGDCYYCRWPPVKLPKAQVVK